MTPSPQAGDAVMTPDGRRMEIREASDINHPHCLRYVFQDGSFADHDPSAATLDRGLVRFVRYYGPTADWREMFR